MRDFFIAVSSLKVNQDAGTRLKRRVHSFTANLVPVIKKLAKSLNYKTLFEALRFAWLSSRKLGKQNTKNCHHRAPPAFHLQLATPAISTQNQSLTRRHAHFCDCLNPVTPSRLRRSARRAKALPWAPESTFNVEPFDHPVQRHARHAQVARGLADIAASTGQASLYSFAVRAPANTVECNIGT